VNVTALAGEQRRAENPLFHVVQSTTSDRSNERSGPPLCALVWRSAAALAAIAVLCAPHTGLAQSSGPTPQPEPVPVTPEQADQVTTEQWAIHGQATYTQQLQPGFRSPFAGPQSLPADANGRETFDATVYLGFRPWQGAEIWFNPEADQGFGLGNSFGVAGYLSGEAYKLGQADPYYRMARAFFRQTIDLGGETQKLDPDLNQLGGTQTANRIVLTIGKLSVVDIFDTNKYAHDPRQDFLNWAILDVGAFDYAADAWGTTYGAAAEWYQDRYAARVGLFDLSNVPNSISLSLPLLHQTQFVAELEERHTLWGQPGKIKVLYWLSRGNLGTYSDALALGAATGTTPSTQAVANYRSKYGMGFNLEQQIAADLGMFVKGGWSQGGVQEDDFTDINASVAAGLSLAGTRWGRPDDTVGLAAVVNEISAIGSQYLAAGGLGGIIGDGALFKSGPESIVETYYSFAAFSFAKVTGDYQFVNNPAYNQQRGPVSVFAFRLRVEF
jgi:high affinity Mn2+ porin